MAHPLIAVALTELRRLGFITEPTGSVKTLTNETAPEDIIDGVVTGWMECNGRALDSSIYPTLYSKIGIRFGNGTVGIGAGGGTDFNIPDLRGQFIRGWNHGASPDSDGNGRDPDAASRGDGSLQGGTGIAGQFTGDQVGSVQGSSYRTHKHSVRGPGATLVTPGPGPSRMMNGPAETSGGFGGNETRPDNITLMYIIKV